MVGTVTHTLSAALFGPSVRKVLSDVSPSVCQFSLWYHVSLRLALQGPGEYSKQ